MAKVSRVSVCSAALFVIAAANACGQSSGVAANSSPDSGTEAAAAGGSGAQFGGGAGGTGPTGGASSTGPDGGGGTGPTGPVTTHPTNILNNGGFEYGLQCFGNWVWSQTGQDFKGDYDFLLSTNAHSGKYALEIQCNGTDCLKAAAYTQLIYTPANQAYKLSVYTQCPSGGSGIVGVAGTSKGEIDQNVTCDANWDRTVLNFTAGSSAGALRLYLYDTSRQWFRADDVVLTDADGGVPAQTVKHGGVRQVRVSGQKVLVDGSPYLALGFYDVPYQDLQRVADLEGNTVVGFGANTNHDCFNTEQQSYLDHAYDLGIGVVPDSTFSARLDTPAIFSPIIDRFAPHLANLAWYLDDEPDQESVPRFVVQPDTLVNEYKAIKAKTNLPVAAVFQRADWGTASDIAPYTGSVDLWMAEPYGTDFGGITKAIANFSANASRPIWLAQDDISASYIVPKAYFAVTSGVTGILYFDWPTFKKEQSKLDAAGQAFTELGSLKNVVFAPKANGVTAPSGLSYLARTYQGKTYVIAVNPTSATVSGAFAVPSLAAGTTVTVLFESRTITAASGQFTDTFNGVTRHVYRVE